VTGPDLSRHHRLAVGVARAGQAKIRNLDIPLIPEEEIEGLEVAVDDPALVEVFHPLRDLLGELDHPVYFKLASIDVQHRIEIAAPQ